MPLLDHFNILAPFYEKFIQSSEPTTLFKLLEMPPDGILLDVGGGTGRISQYFLGHAHRIVIADASLGMLNQARQRDLLMKSCSHAERLPFANESIDRIMMVDALHHIHDQSHAVDEMWRVLKPGGRMVIGEPDVRQPAIKMVALAEKLALMRSHFLTPEEILGLFRYPGAFTTMLLEGHDAWIKVEKRNISSGQLRI
jgi:ubiquinone/menaquinone biosynthesis C-methylase UbiE